MWPQWSLVFPFLCNPLPLVWAESGNLLLMERIWQSGGMSILRLGHKRLCLSPSLSLALSLAGTLALALVCLLDEASWRCPCGKELRMASSQWPARNWGHESNSLQRNESCQQPCELGRGSLSSPSFKWERSLRETQKQRTQSGCAQIPDPKKSQDNECALF